MLGAELALQPAFDAIGAPLEQVAEAAVVGQNVRTVAVLDSGVHWRHPYLRPHCTDPGWDFIEERPDATPDERSDHGTQMAGVIAAFAQRVNMRLSILPLRVTGTFASGIGAGFSTSRIVRAIDLAATRGADVIVIARSWPQDSFAVRDAIRAAASAGTLIVISAGNAGEDIDCTRCIPACHAREFPDHVLTVRAVGTTSKSPCSSNYFADLPLLAAPGWQIKTTSGSAYYARRFGQSSAAAAIVSAAAALVSHRLLDPAQRAPAAVSHWLRSHARRERHCKRDGLHVLGRDEHLELDLRDLPRANQGKTIATGT
jgi:subtilisin family serine protease